MFQLRALSDPPAVPTTGLTIVRQPEIRKERSGKFLSPGRCQKKSSDTKPRLLGMDQLSSPAASVKASPAPVPQVAQQHQQQQQKPQQNLPLVQTKTKTTVSVSNKQTAPAPAGGSNTAKYRYASIRDSVDAADSGDEKDNKGGEEDDNKGVEEEDEDEEAVPPITSSAKVAAPMLAASIRVASMGDVIVGTVGRETILPKQPIKGRAGPLKQQFPLENSNSGASSAEPLSLSAAGLYGKSASLQRRSVAPSAEYSDEVVIKPKREAVEMSDEIDSVSPLRKPKQTIQVVIPHIPSPDKIVRKNLDVEKRYMPSESGVGSYSSSAVDEPRMFALDSSLAEAHMAQVRGVRLNEEMSKEGAQRMLDQLRQKREGRARGVV